jgi:hypothetical protein
MSTARQTAPSRDGAGSTATAANVQEKTTRGSQANGQRRVRFNVGEHCCLVYVLMFQA